MDTKNLDKQLVINEACIKLIDLENDIQKFSDLNQNRLTMHDNYLLSRWIEELYRVRRILR